MATPSMTKLYPRKIITPSIHSLLGTRVYGESRSQIYLNRRRWFEFIRDTPSRLGTTLIRKHVFRLRGFKTRLKVGGKGMGEDVAYLRLQQERRGCCVGNEIDQEEWWRYNRGFRYRWRGLWAGVGCECEYLSNGAGWLELLSVLTFSVNVKCENNFFRIDSILLTSILH